MFQFTRQLIVGGLATCLAFVIGASTTSAGVIVTLDASQGVLEGVANPAEDGDNVTSWEDQTGNNDANFSFSPAITSTNPVFSATAHEGGPALNFTASDSRLQIASSLIVGTGDFKIQATILLGDDTARGYSLIDELIAEGGATASGRGPVREPRRSPVRAR